MARTLLEVKQFTSSEEFVLLDIGSDLQHSR